MCSFCILGVGVSDVCNNGHVQMIRYNGEMTLLKVHESHALWQRLVCSLALCASNAASLSFFYRAVLRIILKHSLLSVLPNSDKVHMSKARLGLCRILTTARDCAGATDDDGSRSPVSIQHSSSSVRQSGQYGGLTLQAQTELSVLLTSASQHLIAFQVSFPQILTLLQSPWPTRCSAICVASSYRHRHLR